MSKTESSSSKTRLRARLRLVALLIVLGALGFWFAKGSHRGWSQNKVPTQQTDEITGIGYVTYEDRFVPGVDWLLGAAVLSTGLFALSFFFRQSTHKNE